MEPSILENPIFNGQLIVSLYFKVTVYLLLYISKVGYTEIKYSRTAIYGTPVYGRNSIYGTDRDRFTRHGDDRAVPKNQCSYAIFI